jgi:8-oxo-dGTP pyrophosphatase MutT (NUDIX family)
MVCRKHSFGLIDFIRGKYAVNNKYYITNMVNQMTQAEKHMLVTLPFEEIWQYIWKKPADFKSSKSEDSISCEKFNALQNGITVTLPNGETETYTLKDIINGGKTAWTEPEWGFPKGKRNYNESDLDCAVREFEEETGLHMNKKNIVANIAPYEEKFCGSNYKTYKNKYLLASLEYSDNKVIVPDAESNEISAIEWKTFKECIACIRPYNLEKKRMLSSIDILLKTLKEHRSNN